LALIPSFFMDCVVAIGAGHENNISWFASGFLYGEYLRVEKDESVYNVFLATNNHVFKDFSSVYLRFNPQGNESAKNFLLRLVGRDDNRLWFAHPNEEIDVAITQINLDLLKKYNIRYSFFHSDIDVAPIDKMNELGIAEGDSTYTLGFPLGIVGEQRNVVVVRSGSIARIKDVLAKTNIKYLVDTFIFPGNSGGPVISRPELISIVGTKSQDKAYLIGIVSSYLTYRDEAISTQTKQTRVIFEENSGLATVFPVDYVEETIKEYYKTISIKRD